MGAKHPKYKRKLTAASDDYSQQVHGVLIQFLVA
jgi:hypothetical protein